MKKLLFVASALAALSLLAPSSGFAQAADNQIGIYFDTAATVTDFTPSPTVPFDVYLLLTKPVDNDGAPVTEVEAFEVMVTFSNGAGVFKLGETLPPGAINVGDTSNPAVGLEYTVGLATPVIVTNDVAQLVTIQLMVIAVAENFIYMNNSTTGNMYYQEGGTQSLVNFYPSSGNTADPVFAIAGTVTPVESSTWGGVKSLYR